MRRFYPPTDSDIPMHGWRPYSDIHRERIRAHAKHDDNGESMERRDWDDNAWLSTCVEEVGEVARVLCEIRHRNLTEAEGIEKLREELVQTAAMFTAWIDSIDLDG